MSFDTQIQQISAEQLDQIFDSTPDGTPSADTLALGKTGEEVEQGNSLHVGTGDIDNINPDDIPDADAESKPADTKKVKKEKVETTDAVTEEGEKVEDQDELDLEEPETNAEVTDVLRSTVDYLIESGTWVDFEGREDLEITEEVYAELAVRQNQAAAYEMVNELIDSTGDYGKAIIGHIKNGGNPDEVIDIFKAQKEMEQMDTSTEDGKQVLIEKYYKDLLGWKADKVKKHLNRLVEDDEVDSEFSDVKEHFDKHYKEQLNQVHEKTKAQEVEKKAKQQVFQNSIKQAIHAAEDLTVRDRQIIERSILDFKHTLDNGQKVNDFYLKFAEIQADPKKYVELVRFAMDMEGYKNSVKTKEQSTADRKAFSFIKGNKAIAKPSTNKVEIEDKRGSTASGTNFAFALNKRT